jgi:hypothetical protein
MALTSDYRKQGLDVGINAYDPATGKVLNNSLKILVRFGLIERTEIRETGPDDSPPALVDEIDIIRLHSMVQRFFMHSSLSQGELVRWLDRAIALFCRSFSM